MKLTNKIKAMFKNRQIKKSGLPDMNEGAYHLKERFPVLGDTPVSYELTPDIVNFYANIGAQCEACLEGISDLSELNEGYFDQTIDIKMHIGLQALHQQRLTHMHAAKAIDREVRRAINQKRSDIERFEESLKKVQDDIVKVEKIKSGPSKKQKDDHM